MVKNLLGFCIQLVKLDYTLINRHKIQGFPTSLLQPNPRHKTYPFLIEVRSLPESRLFRGPIHIAAISETNGMCVLLSCERCPVVVTNRTQNPASVISQEVFTGARLQALWAIWATVVLCSTALLLKLASISRTQSFICLQPVYCWRREHLHLLCRFFRFSTNSFESPLFSDLLKKKGRRMGRHKGGYRSKWNINSREKVEKYMRRRYGLFSLSPASFISY
jgi:hypothetical protein